MNLPIDPAEPAAVPAEGGAPDPIAEPVAAQPVPGGEPGEGAASDTPAGAAPDPAGSADPVEEAAVGTADPGDAAETTAAETATAEAAAAEAATAATIVAKPAPARRRGPVHRALHGVFGVLRRIPHPPLRSRRGLILLFFLIAGFGSAATLGGVMMIHYTETSSFCGRCHTMGPELKAYQMSAHRDVACAECHVAPGVSGFVQAKINGTKQLFQVATGTYPEPIPPPDHSSLPPVSQTCLRCHSLDRISANGGPIKLVLRPTYQSDEKNTRELVAVVLRPTGLGGSTGTTTGVHWHVQEKVTYATAHPEGAQKIDLVEVTRPDGKVEQYVSAAKINGSADVTRDVANLKATQTTRTMDCLDCHNRVGHAVPSIGQALDSSIASGKISAALPFIKLQGSNLLGGNYDSLAAADTAIAGLKDTYRQKYPLVATSQSAEVGRAVTELQRLYRELASPDMKVQAQTYPDNLGHSSSPGCFRCHDGTHMQVVNGKPTGKTIPSTCSTCHTFPQVGGQVSGILIGAAPVTHDDRLYVFNHKNLVNTSDPSGTSCGQCHQRAYCENCHSTGAVKVTHDQMLYNHAASIRKSGGQACAYCHQPVYCTGCHGKEPVLQTVASDPADRPDVNKVAAP
ncbi:MAG TPA: NapC/NirT family cytochrome c [Kineosporiaceae bacterium]|nr:NapC/NirT family cytochrome c [Kineosporiaceae bacterium]